MNSSYKPHGYTTVVYRADLLLPILTAFLDAPMPEAK